MQYADFHRSTHIASVVQQKRRHLRFESAAQRGGRWDSPSGAAPQASCQASGSLTEVSVRLVGKLLRTRSLLTLSRRSPRIGRRRLQPPVVVCSNPATLMHKKPRTFIRYGTFSSRGLGHSRTHRNSTSLFAPGLKKY